MSVQLEGAGAATREAAKAFRMPDPLDWGDYVAVSLSRMVLAGGWVGRCAGHVDGPAGYSCTGYSSLCAPWSHMQARLAAEKRHLLLLLLLLLCPPN